MEKTIENTNDQKLVDDPRPTVVVDGKERRVNLTPEQVEQICFEGIYRADPEDFRDDYSISRYWDTSGKYHCRNWCFRISVGSNGDVLFIDTYWGTSSDTHFRVNSDNFEKMIGRFKLIMDSKDNYHPISNEDAMVYEPSDIAEAAFGSGGWEYSNTKWVREDALPSPRRELTLALREARYAMRSVFDTRKERTALRDLIIGIREVQERGMDLDDATEMKKRDEYFDTLESVEMKLGDAGRRNMEQWLAEKAYCPGEIYCANGIGYRLFDANDTAYKFAERQLVTGDALEYLYIPDRESVVMVRFVPENKEGITGVLNAVHCDATEHNIRLLFETDGEIPFVDLDDFPVWHGNGDAEEVAEKLDQAIKAIEELRSALVGDEDLR